MSALSNLMEPLLERAKSKRPADTVCGGPATSRLR
jgi:hypothetical protein